MQTAPFGKTGHQSSRVIFGAAALGGMRQEKCDPLLDLLLEHGINHLDTAAMYGDSELRLAPWLKRHRKDFFLATKTGDRTYDTARDSIHRSLERMGVDQIDLIQMHNLVEEDEWQTAMGPGGALEALIEARDQKLVRFIGVTGHGTRIAGMHRRSLERFAFDSVLLPYNFTMMSMPDYAADFEALVTLCEQRGVAVQTIKSIARRRWEGQGERRFSWYEPLRDPDAIRRAVAFVLGRPGVFLNTSSDATLLSLILQSAEHAGSVPTASSMQADVDSFAMHSLFGQGAPDVI